MLVDLARHADEHCARRLVGSSSTGRPPPVAACGADWTSSPRAGCGSLGGSASARGPSRRLGHAARTHPGRSGHSSYRVSSEAPHEGENVPSDTDNRRGAAAHLRTPAGDREVCPCLVREVAGLNGQEGCRTTRHKRSLSPLSFQMTTVHPEQGFRKGGSTASTWSRWTAFQRGSMSAFSLCAADGLGTSRWPAARRRLAVTQSPRGRLVRCCPATATCSADESDGARAVVFVRWLGEVFVGEDDLGACGCVEDELRVEFDAGNRDAHGRPFADQRERARRR
jgi:hypothetical protein